MMLRIDAHVGTAAPGCPSSEARALLLRVPGKTKPPPATLIHLFGARDHDYDWLISLGSSANIPHIA